MRELIRKLRRNHLLILFTAGFIITLGALLLEIDRQYYLTEKRNYIKDNWYSLFPIKKEELTYKARIILESPTSEIRDRYMDELRIAIQEIIDGPLSIYSIELVDAEGDPIISISEPRKLRRYNTFKNSLLLRSFESKADHLIGNVSNTGVLGRLIVLYTTPLGDEFLQNLTTRYRLYCIAIILVLTLVYAYFVKYLILPVKRVVGYLDKAGTKPPEIIRYPGSYLERVYNNLSRNALLSRIDDQMNELASSTPLPHLTQVLQDIPTLIHDLFRYPFVAVFELKKNEANSYATIGKYVASNYVNDEGASSLESELHKMIQNHREKDISAIFQTNLKLMFLQRRKRWWFIDIVYSSREFDTIACLAMLPIPQSERDLTDFDIETLKMISRQVREGISSLEMRRQIIFKEKSETNISLARRLGHDLTNIIATSKLDLVSIKHYLEIDTVDALKNPQKKELFRHSLQGLLNNTRFLQEIVDIYRSFSYVKNPLYNNLNLNKMLDDIVDVFQQAMSRNVTIVKNYQHDLPDCVLEERLFKLAIFNLLNNAMESCAKNDLSSQKKITIDIATYYNPATDEFSITIRDYGPGIRTKDDALLPETEMNKLFMPGYTTKNDEDSEGLGLNWVWTIICDFHNGTIIPSNCPDGGAQFKICFNRKILAARINNQDMTFKNA